MHHFAREAGQPCFSSGFRLLILAFFSSARKLKVGLCAALVTILEQGNHISKLAVFTGEALGRPCDQKMIPSQPWNRSSRETTHDNKHATEMTQNVPLQTRQANSSTEVTQQGEISAVTSPSPLGCELATDPAAGAQEHSLAPGCRHWQGQAENGLGQRKRSDLASREKTPLEEGSVHEHWSAARASGHTETVGKINLECCLRL